MQGQQLGGGQLGRHIGQLETGALELANRLAKLLARRGPFGRHFHHPLTAPHTGGGHRQARSAQPLAHQVKALAFVAQALVGRHPAIGEKQFALVVAPVRDAGRPAPHGQAGRIQVDQKAGDFFLGSMRRVLDAGGGKQHHKVAHIGVADEVLGAVDEVVGVLTTAVAGGTGLHAAHVRAGVGLGHGQAVVARPADGGQQIFLDLRALAGAQDIARPRHQHLQAIGRAPQLALEQRHREIVQPAAAQLGGHIGRVQTHLDGLGLDGLHQFGRYGVGALDQVLVRVQLFFDKCADSVHDHGLFACQGKLHGAAF